MILQGTQRLLIVTACCALLLTATSRANAADSPASAPRLTSAATELPASATEIKCVFTCSDGMELTGQWIAENCERTPRGYKIGSAKIVSKGPLNAFSLSRPTKGWPKGVYRLEITHQGRTIYIARYLMGTDVQGKRQPGSSQKQ